MLRLSSYTRRTAPTRWPPTLPCTRNVAFHEFSAHRIHWKHSLRTWLLVSSVCLALVPSCALARQSTSTLCLSTASFFAALLATLVCRDSVTLFGFAGPRSNAAAFYFGDEDAQRRALLSQRFKPVASLLGVLPEFQSAFQEQRVEFQILARIASGRAPPLLWAWRRALRREPESSPPNVTFAGQSRASIKESISAPTLPPNLFHVLRPLPRSYSAELPPVGDENLQFKDDDDWKRLVRGFQLMEREFAKKYDVDVASVKRLEGFMANLPRDRLIESTRSSTRVDKLTANEYDQPPTGHRSPLRIPVVPPEYESVADALPLELTDPRHFKLEFSDNTYPPVKELGHGTYGTAFLCFAATNNTYASADVRRIALVERQPLVIKVLKSASLVKLARELQVLAVLRGLPHTLQLLDTVRMGDGHFGFVVPFTNLSNYRDVFPLMSAPAVRDYVRKVLVALDGAHSRGIVHLDLKPLNIFFDHRTGELQVGDWGLSRFYHRNVSLSWRTMTAYYKAPEVFMGSPFYSYAVDMWSLGAVFAGMIVGRFHFFEGKNMDDVADQWIEHLGTDEWDAFVRKYRFDVDPRWARRHTPQRRLPTPWLWYIREQNRHMISAEALDLLSRMLRFDPVERITAREALMHPYFTSEMAPARRAAHRSVLGMGTEEKALKEREEETMNMNERQ
jgi:casein kinase II subunit alpha